MFETAISIRQRWLVLGVLIAVAGLRMSSAQATCGDYLYVRGLSPAERGHGPVTHDALTAGVHDAEQAPRPCHGPSCHNGQRPVLPVAPASTTADRMTDLIHLPHVAGTSSPGRRLGRPHRPGAPQRGYPLQLEYPPEI